MINGVLQKFRNFFIKEVVSQETENKKLYNWYDDRINRVRLQRNFLVLFVIASLVIIIVIVISILSIASFKTIEPFVIEISSRSGVATLVEPTTVKQYSADRKVIEYFLFKYLKSRELFNPDTYKYDYYRVVRLLSNSQAYSDFRSYVSTSNPDSPVNLYSKSDNMTLKIRSMQYLDINNIQVRFVLIIKYGNSTKEVNRIANVKYFFSEGAMSEEDRYINPLGFKVTSYKVDNENLI